MRGVFPAVLGHVDELACLLDQAERRFANRFRWPHKRDNRPVGTLSGIDIKQSAPLYRFDHICDGLDDFWATSLTDVGDAFYQALHGTKVARHTSKIVAFTPPRFPR